MDLICLNCEAAQQQTFKYCPSCSQKIATHRLSMHEVFHEAIHYFTHADKGFFQLIRDLVKKRGVVAYEYIAGKRKKYFSPLSFFLLSAAIYVFVINLQELPNPENVLKEHPELANISDPIKKQEITLRYERIAKTIQFTNKYSNLMAMASLPLTAFIFWMFYKRSKYNYTEHLVASMYMLGFSILVYSLLIFPLALVADVPSNYQLLGFFVFQMFYSYLFYTSFLKKQTIIGRLKIVATVVVCCVAWGVISSGIARIYITNGFWGMLQ